MTQKIGATTFGLTSKYVSALFITLALVSALAVNPAYSQNTTITAVTPSPSSVTIGNTITFTATVTDTSGSPITPTGTVTWTDGSSGIFTTSPCTLATVDSTSAACTVVYTPPSLATTLTITATYNPDANILAALEHQP
jgi:Big-like domain-containing protein